MHLIRTVDTFRLAIASVYLTTSALADEKLTFFESKIRPIFVEKCYDCHSVKAAEQNKLKGGFYIDIREG